MNTRSYLIISSCTGHLERVFCSKPRSSSIINQSRPYQQSPCIIKTKLILFNAFLKEVEFKFDHFGMIGGACKCNNLHKYPQFCERPALRVLFPWSPGQRNVNPRPPVALSGRSEPHKFKGVLQVRTCLALFSMDSYRHCPGRPDEIPFTPAMLQALGPRPSRDLLEPFKEPFL